MAATMQHTVACPVTAEPSACCIVAAIREFFPSRNSSICQPVLVQKPEKSGENALSILESLQHYLLSKSRMHCAVQLLYDTFSAFGMVIATPKIMRDPDSGSSRGFGFVSFDGFEASDAAIEAMNGQYLCNRYPCATCDTPFLYTLHMLCCVFRRARYVCEN